MRDEPQKCLRMRLNPGLLHDVFSFAVNLEKFKSQLSHYCENVKK